MNELGQGLLIAGGSFLVLWVIWRFFMMLVSSIGRAWRGE